MPTDLLSTIGNTPLVQLKRLSPKPSVRMFAKMESFNPTGSVKDRIAKRLIEEGEKTGHLAPGHTIIEASTGNTGISLAFVGRAKGYHVQIVVPSGVMPEVQQLLDVFSAEVTVYEGPAGMKGAAELAEGLATKHGYYATRQFANPQNVATHYETTAAEIVREMPNIDVFIAGLGTGGTLMGVGRRLKEHSADAKVIAVEPHPGMAVQGIRNVNEGFIPPILDLSLLDGKYLSSARRAFEMTRRLWREEGMFVGVSSGAVAAAAVRLAEKLERGNIVLLFADAGWKYLNPEPWRRIENEAEDELEDVIWW